MTWEQGPFILSLLPQVIMSIQNELSALWLNHLMIFYVARYIDAFSGCCKLAAARFDVWSSDEELTTDMFFYQSWGLLHCMYLRPGICKSWLCCSLFVHVFCWHCMNVTLAQQSRFCCIKALIMYVIFLLYILKMLSYLHEVSFQNLCFGEWGNEVASIGLFVPYASC